MGNKIDTVYIWALSRSSAIPDAILHEVEKVMTPISNLKFKFRDPNSKNEMLIEVTKKVIWLKWLWKDHLSAYAEKDTKNMRIRLGNLKRALDAITPLDIVYLDCWRSNRIVNGNNDRFKFNFINQESETDLDYDFEFSCWENGELISGIDICRLDRHFDTQRLINDIKMRCEAELNMTKTHKERHTEFMKSEIRTLATIYSYYSAKPISISHTTTFVRLASIAHAYIAEDQRDIDEIAYSIRDFIIANKSVLPEE